jgi:maleylpyruvate isomerase
MSGADAIDIELDAMKASTHSLERTIADLRDDQVDEPSLLDGWTRGHVMTHIARNADAMCNLATWARTGVRTPMYESREHRDADIQAGAGRSAWELRSDVLDSAQRLATAFAALEAEHWLVPVQMGKDNRPVEMSGMPHHRRVEVEIHHVDLDLDYTLAHLPTDFVLDMLGRVATDLSARDGMTGLVLVANDNEGRWIVAGGGPEVTGTPPSLLGWILGRTGGIGVFSAEPLPSLAAWR